MTHQELKTAADKFKENFIQVIVESKRTGSLSAGILNPKNDQLTIYVDGYSTTYIKSEVEECFTIHDYNDWSV